MKSITLMDMLLTKSFSNILKLKCELIKQKNMGMVFYKEDISKLPIDHPFEFYYETESPFDSLYFENLSLFKGKKFVWFYKGGISNVS